MLTDFSCREELNATDHFGNELYQITASPVYCYAAACLCLPKPKLAISISTLEALSIRSNAFIDVLVPKISALLVSYLEAHSISQLISKIGCILQIVSKLFHTISTAVFVLFGSIKKRL